MTKIKFTSIASLLGLWLWLISLAHATTNPVKLPDLGAPDLALYDPQTEKKFGQAFTRSLNTEFSLSQDLEVIDYIRQVGHKVAMHSGQSRDFRFYVIDNEAINAFAGPNGVIGIHTGLINAVKSEAELASVIAHEIAHITQQHLSRRFLYNSTQGSTTSVATLLAAILIGMVDPNAGMATLMAGQSLGIEKQLANSRQHENEADFVGIKILHDAGFDAHAMADFFGRLADASRNNEFQVPEILRTHPVTRDRLVQAESRANNLLPIRQPKPSDELTLIKLRLNYLHNLQDWALSQKNQTLTKNQACYQLNLIELAKDKPSDDHLNCLVLASNSQLDHPLYTNLLIERLTDLTTENTQFNPSNSAPPSSAKHTGLKKLVEKTLEMAKFHVQMHLQRITTLIKISEFFLANHQPTKAIQWFKQHNQESKYNYHKQQTLANIYHSQNNQILANLTQAEAQQAIFNYSAAKHFFEQAKKLNTAQKGEFTQDLENFLRKYEDTFTENKVDN